MRARTLLVFSVGGQLCAIPAGSVKEVVPMAALTRAPGQPSVLEGFLNLRGEAVPVVRLDRLFGTPASPPGLYSALIILGSSPRTALLADHVVELAAPPPEAWQALEDYSSFNGCAEAQVQLEAGLVPVLSPHRILLAREQEAVRYLQEQAQRCLEELDRSAQ